jgi:hypothetical protein
LDLGATRTANKEQAYLPLTLTARVGAVRF